MIVDDDVVLLRAIQSVFTHLGHRVWARADAAAAFQVIESEPLDGLVTDLSLPCGGGIRLAERASIRIPALRVVVYSGRSMPAALPGRARFVQKPVFDKHRHVRAVRWAAMT